MYDRWEWPEETPPFVREDDTPAAFLKFENGKWGCTWCYKGTEAPDAGHLCSDQHKKAYLQRLKYHGMGEIYAMGKPCEGSIHRMWGDPPIREVEEAIAVQGQSKGNGKKGKGRGHRWAGAAAAAAKQQPRPPGLRSPDASGSSSGSSWRKINKSELEALMKKIGEASDQAARSAEASAKAAEEMSTSIKDIVKAFAVAKDTFQPMLETLTKAVQECAGATQSATTAVAVTQAAGATSTVAMNGVSEKMTELATSMEELSKSLVEQKELKEKELQEIRSLQQDGWSLEVGP